MISACLEFLAMALTVGGTLLVMVACGLPTWKVSAHIEGNIVVAQSIWDGLWMSCAVQSTGQMQCKLHDSVLALSKDIQTARALTVMSAVLGVLGLMVTIAGAQCTNCIQTECTKTRVVNAAGVINVVAGFFVLVPLCWTANIIISDFHNPQVPNTSKREIGSAIYIGFAAAALLLLGGAILCCCCPKSAKASHPPAKYPASKSATQNGGYDKQNYV